MILLEFLKNGNDFVNWYWLKLRYTYIHQYIQSSAELIK